MFIHKEALNDIFLGEDQWYQDNSQTKKLSQGP